MEHRRSYGGRNAGDDRRGHRGDDGQRRGGGGDHRREAGYREGGGHNGGGSSRERNQRSGGGQHRGGGYYEGGQRSGGGGSRSGSDYGQGQRGGAGCPGYRGRSRGGGGGGGGPPVFLPLPDPYLSYPPDKLNQQGKIGGWRHMPGKKEEISVQKYTGKPATWAMNKISVSVNHFLVEPLARSGKPKFPIPSIYHYDINYEVVRERHNKNEGEGSSPSSGQSTPKVPPKRKRLSDRDSGRPELVRRLSQQLEESAPGESMDQERSSNPPPRKLPKHLTKAILDLLIPRIRKQSGHHAIATDGSFNLYTTKLLDDSPNPMKHKVTFAELRMAKLYDEDDNATVLVTLVPSTTPAGGIHTIDTLDISRYFETTGSLRGFEFTAEMRQTLEAACNAFVKSMPNFQYFAVGRSTMVPCEKNQTCPLGGGLVAWKGVSANIAMGWKPYMNVDIANCAFILNEKVHVVLQQLIRDSSSYGDVSRWSSRDFDEVRSLLKTCKVRYTINGMVRGGPIRDIPKESAKQITFLWEDEKTSKRISVYDYYRERYGCKLKYPNGAILELRKKGTYVPAELCTIKAGQSYNRKLDGNQTTQMISFAKRNPQEKVRDINERMTEMKLDQNLVIEQLGIKVADQMLNIKEARVLVPPTLRYGPSKENNGTAAYINPQGGTWEVWRQETDFAFYKGTTINQWGVLVVGCPRVREDEVTAFTNCLTKNSERKGVKFGNKRPFPIKLDKTDRRGTSPEQNATDFSRYFSQDFRGCDLVLVVIPEKGNPLYNAVKHAAEVDVGMLTQCVIQKHVQRVNDSVVQNIILKINSKMGGINHVTVKPILEPSKAEQFCTVLQDCPVMILGADVTHAPPGSKKFVNGREFIMPSYAAVTGSLDPTCMPFMTEVRAQRKANAGAAEVIQDLEVIVLKMLECYKATWSGNRMPCKIIYFRDGVGEGQFPELLHVEMNAIRRACMKIGSKYEPKITFITVQKRHKTRMFYQTGGGRVENVPAGTVVDTEIVHPTETDFYLCSHKGMMGTSRPSRYHVLWDDSEFSQDELQSLAYTLCYMYARCTKSVKMPAATYYAHLAADRAKKLCEGFETKRKQEPTEENLNKMLKRSGMSKYPMHFV